MKDRIKQIRIESKLNQTDFAARLGVKQASVSGWERGLYEPDERSIKSICREFNVNYAWLVHGIGDTYIESDDDFIEYLCNHYGMSSKDEIQLVQRYFKLPKELRNELVLVCKKLLNEISQSNSKTGST